MADLFAALDWFAALLIAGALALAVLTEKEVPAVRVLLASGIALTIVRWFMWSFQTDASWPVRAVIGALMGGILLGAAPAMWKWVGTRSSQIEAHSADGHASVSPPLPWLEERKLTAKAHNFSKSLRDFRDEFLEDDRKWRKMEQGATRDAEGRTDQNSIWEESVARAQGRQQNFTNRFQQVYKDQAVVLSDDLRDALKKIGVVPLTPGFSTPLPSGFDTFKVTLESPAMRAIVSENAVLRIANYFDQLCSQFPHEVGDDP